MPLTWDSYDPQLLRKRQLFSDPWCIQTAKRTIVDSSWNVGQCGNCSKCGGIQDTGFVIITYQLVLGDEQ